MLGLFSGQYTPDLHALASFDFERTRALADRFQREEVRMMARLLVVYSVLGDQPGAGMTAPRRVTAITDVAPATTTTTTKESTVEDDDTP
jgi:hypothetical protein